MSAKDLLLRLIFRADAREAKAATKEVQAGIADVTATTKTSTAATDQDTAATAKNAQARRDAAKAAQDQAVAERAAREAALRATTGTGTAPRPPQSQDAPGLSEADKTAIRARYVPMAAADQAYRKEVDELAAAAKSGALSADEVAQAQARVQTRYDHAVEAIRRSDAALSGNSRNMKLSAFEARNLSYQINDVVQSLMMGMPAQQVLMQQGPQITQIYGGVGNTFRALRSVLTPTRLLLGGVSAAAITGATAWNQYLRSTMAVTAEMDGLGRGLARSPAELEAAARAGAAAAGISIRAAREMQVAFLHTGRIRSEHYADLIAISKDFAATMGIDAGAAGGALAEMFADPAKAADTLYGKYGLIDAATARYVRNLAAQNRESEAQGVLLDRLPEKLANAEDRMHALDRAMQGIKNTASGLWDGLGEGIDRMFSGPTLDEEISKAEGELDRLEKLPKNRVRQSTIENARARLSALMEQRRVRDAAAEQAQQRSEAERLGRKAITIAEGSGATSRMRQEQDLRNEITALDKGKDAPGLDAFQQQEITQALEAKRRVLDALIGRQDRLAQLDRLEVQISAEKNPMIRAELEARRTRLQMAQEEVAQGEIDSAAARARQKVIEQTVTSTKAQATELTAEAEIRARLTAQVAAGLIRSEDVNRLLQEELTLRPLVAAAAAAEGEEKKRLADVVDALRDAYRLQAQTMADARATDYLLSERERVAELRLEVALLGQSERVRARVLAQYQAEQKIRELGATGERAEQIRREAVANADLTAELDKQIDAWGRVKDAAEAAIDGAIDRLAEGDIAGALGEIAQEAGDMMLELAAKNQMKNLILGTDLPTLTDVGGIGGIWDRLTGKAGPLQAQAMQAGAMSVTTPMVTLNATSIAGLGSMSFAQAGIGAAPGALGGSVDVQQQVWDFFARKNLKPHQIAGIMGNISAESGFNPLNVGDYGKAHGLFQWNDRAPKLFDFIGGQGNLGNVQAQLEFAWQELLTSENGPLKRLLAAPDLYSATHAFTGFERPSGYDAANPSSAAGWSQRLAGAEAALARFGATTSSATDGLSTFGTGLDSFGRDLFGGLQGLFGGGQGGAGGGGGFWSTFGTMIAGAFGIPGFAVGGTAPDGIIAVSNGEFYVPGAVAGPNMAALEAINAGRPAAAGMISGPGTGTSDSIMMPARAGDFIVNAAATARNRPLLEAMIAGRPMQRLASGGQVLSRSPIQMPAVAAAAADHTSHMTSDTRPVIQIMNNSSARVEAEVEETTDASGRRAWRLMMADAVGDALQTPGGGAKKKLASMGVRPRSALR